MSMQKLDMEKKRSSSSEASRATKRLKPSPVVVVDDQDSDDGSVKEVDAPDAVLHVPPTKDLTRKSGGASKSGSSGGASKKGSRKVTALSAA